MSTCNTRFAFITANMEAFKWKFIDIFEDVCSLHRPACFSADSFHLCCITPCESSGRFFRATRYIKHFNGDTEIDHPLAQSRPFKSMTVDKWAKNINRRSDGRSSEPHHIWHGGTESVGYYLCRPRPLLSLWFVRQYGVWKRTLCSRQSQILVIATVEMPTILNF